MKCPNCDYDEKGRVHMADGRPICYTPVGELIVITREEMIAWDGAVSKDGIRATLIYERAT